MRVEAKRRHSRLAIWSRRAALLSVLATLAAVIGSRTDVIGAEPALGLLALGLTSAVCAILAALIAFATIWRDARRGFGAAVLGLILGAAILAYPGILFTRLFTLPAIADVSTSPDDPIPFLAVAWDHAAPTVAQIAAQRVAYPEIVPHVYAADPSSVFDEVLLLAGDRNWQIDLAEPPIFAPTDPAAIGDPAAAEPAAPPLMSAGFVTAEARTWIVGFREDVVIRVSAGPAGAIVDMRSASRVFAHDFGSDARRIADFLRDLDGRLTRVSPG